MTNQQSLIVRTPIFTPEASVRVPAQLENFYGKGLSLPLRLRSSRWDGSKTLDKIRESIFIILTTPLGSRFMRPDFGSMLPFMIHQVMAAGIFEAELMQNTADALDRWEPRVVLQDVKIDMTERIRHQVSIVVGYGVRGLGASERLDLPIDLTAQPAFIIPDTFTYGNGRKVFS